MIGGVNDRLLGSQGGNYAVYGENSTLGSETRYFVAVSPKNGLFSTFKDRLNKFLLKSCNCVRNDTKWDPF